MTLSEPIPQMQEITYPDRFDLARRDAEYRIQNSVGEAQRPDVVLKAQQIHGKSYVEYGYFDESGQLSDGRLVDELDGTRSEPNGKRIANYLVATHFGMPITEASATVRLLDIGDNGSIEDLPTYGYFAETFNDDVKAKLDGILRTYGDKSIREIAALGTTDIGEHRGSFELIRAMVQNSMLKEDVGQPELYIASLTNKSLHPVLQFIGYDSAEQLAVPVQIFSGDTRSRSIYVTPLLIDLSRVVTNTMNAIENAATSDEAIKLQEKLTFLVDGLEPDLLDRYFSNSPVKTV